MIDIYDKKKRELVDKNGDKIQIGDTLLVRCPGKDLCNSLHESCKPSMRYKVKILGSYRGKEGIFMDGPPGPMLLYCNRNFFEIINPNEKSNPMKNIQPLRDNILVRIFIEKSDLALTEDLLKQRVQNSPKAEVIAVGSQVKDVQVGDKVYFQKWQKSEVTGIENDGELYALIREEHIDAKYV